jgi:hypothetical protein
MHDVCDSVTNYLRRRLVRLLIQISALQPTLQRRMNKKRWSEGIDLHPLSGEEWLRLVVETNMDALVGWCARCRVGECYREKCQWCGAALVKLDETFWSQVGCKIRRAMRKDRALLSRVKSDRENLYGSKHKPRFPLPLMWLHELWDQAPRPSHQPFVPKVHYQVANWIEFLRRFGLSNEEALEVLRQDDFPDGQFTRQGKDYANIPGEDLRKLGKVFRPTDETLPCSVNSLSEMGRTIKWVNRQRTLPMVRLKGERVRNRKSSGV